MAKKKSESLITLPLDTFEDFIWMSYRYCIGRSTIASHCHANEVARVLSNYNEQTQVKNAIDIQRCVNDIVRIGMDWRTYIYGGGEEENVINLCLSYLQENGLMDKMNTIKTIDIDKFENELYFKLVYYSESEECKYRSSIDDLLVWNDVANIYNPKAHKVAVVEYNGQTKEELVYESWQKEYKPNHSYTKHWKSVEKGKLGQLDWWIADECIKEIKDK